MLRKNMLGPLKIIKRQFKHFSKNVDLILKADKVIQAISIGHS